QHYRHDAALHAVAGENVAEARADKHPHAVVEHRVGGALARGPAAEIGAGDEYAGAAVFGPVQHEIRQRALLLVESQIVQEHVRVRDRGWTPAYALEAPGNDHAGVDLGNIERGGDGGEGGKWFHGRYSDLTSASRPVTAAAAAMDGLMICVSAPGPW